MLTATAVSYAQTDTTTFRDSFYVLSPVEVKSVRVSSIAPFAVSNLSSKELQKQNLGQNLPYLLSQTPSLITSSDDGSGVGYTSMRIRGTDITRINVTFNGIPVNDAESHGTFFVNIPDLASSTNSIQIQRGVGSSTNGAGAFGASVNISNIEQSKIPTAYVSNSFGSFNSWKHTLKAGTGLLKNGFLFDVRLSKINADGYIQRAFSDLKALQFIGGWLAKNELTSIKFNLMTGKERTGQAWNGVPVLFETNNTGNFNYQKKLEETGRRFNGLGDKGDGTYYNDQTDNYQQDYYQLFVNHKFNTNWTANVSGFMTRGRGYYNEYKDGDYHEGEKFSSYGLPNYVKAIGDTVKRVNLVRQLWLDNYYYGSVFSVNYNNSKTDFIVGGGITKYDARHYGFIKWAQFGIPLDYRWYNLPAYKRDFNIFAKLQQQITQGLYGFVDVQLRDVYHNIYGFRKNANINSLNHFTFFNPKAGLSYLVQHPYNATSKIFASFAVANKEPNRDDFEASPTQKPRPERLHDFEVGYMYNSPKLSAGVNGYYMKYKDQLILTGLINDVGSYVRTNVDDSYRAGIEITADVKPVEWLQLSANATFSKNKIKSITQYGDNWDDGTQFSNTYTNTFIALSPGTIAGGSLTFDPFYANAGNNRFYIDVVEKYVGRQYLDNSSNKFKSIQPYALTDLRLRYQTSAKWLKEVGVILALNNIFNKKYENNGYTYDYKYENITYTQNNYYPQAGINWNIGLNIAF